MARFTYKDISWREYCRNNLNGLGKKGFIIIESNLVEGKWKYNSQNRKSIYSGDEIHVRMERDSQSESSYEYARVMSSVGDWRLACDKKGYGSGASYTSFFGKQKDDRREFRVKLFFREYTVKSNPESYPNYMLGYYNHNTFQGHDGNSVEFSDFTHDCLISTISMFFEHLKYLREGDKLIELCCFFGEDNILTVVAEMKKNSHIWFSISLRMNGVEAFVIDSYWEINKDIITKMFEFFLEEPGRCASYLLRKIN